MGRRVQHLELGLATCAVLLGLTGIGTVAADRSPTEASSVLVAAPTAAEASSTPAPPVAAASPTPSTPPAPIGPARVGPDLGAVQPEPIVVQRPEDLPPLADRRFVTPPHDFLPPNVDGVWLASVREVSPEVAARSTWHEDCPVTLDELRHVVVTHVGFDGRAHPGELLVHHTVADEFVEIFRQLYEARWPIERMAIVSMQDLERNVPIVHGMDNNTTSFVCRKSVAGGRWSEHARGLAVDINPYHNPYVKGDRVIPPSATSYLVRDDRPGIIHGGDVVDRAFAGIGWYWGGRWSSAIDWMHFSHNDH